MKENRVLHFWDGIYPFLFFYAIVHFSTYGLIGLFPKVNTMITQGIVQIIFILFIIVWMQNKQPIHRERNLKSKKNKWIVVVCMIVSSSLFSMALNQLIDASNLKELSPAYQAVSSSIYEPGKVQILFFVGLIAPIFEELIFRGVLFGQLRKYFSFLFCALISGLTFGGLHLNLVQFVYAFAMGYLFAFFMEEGKSVWFAVTAHVVANITSLMTTWMGSASWMFDHVEISLLLALVEGLLGIVLLNWIKKSFKLLK